MEKTQLNTSYLQLKIQQATKQSQSQQQEQQQQRQQGQGLNRLLRHLRLPTPLPKLSLSKFKASSRRVGHSVRQCLLAPLVNKLGGVRQGRSADDVNWEVGSRLASCSLPSCPRLHLDFLKRWLPPFFLSLYRLRLLSMAWRFICVLYCYSFSLFCFSFVFHLFLYSFLLTRIIVHHHHLPHRQRQYHPRSHPPFIFIHTCYIHHSTHTFLSYFNQQNAYTQIVFLFVPLSR